MPRPSLRFVLALALLLPSWSAAQRADSTRAAARQPANTARRDSIRAPITPRRAFLYSFLVPGSSQAVLGRNKTAVILLTFEAVAISMIRESGADVHEARRLGADSVVAGYTEGTPPVPRKVPGPLTPRGQNGDYIRSRRSHLEDWIAVLVANHLFAGADAYVAANLWDLPTQLSVRSLPDGRTAVGASVSW